MGKQVKVGGGESKNRLKRSQEFHTCWQMCFRYWRKTVYSKNSVEQLVSILKQKWAGGCLPSPDSKSNSSWIRALTKEPISPRGTRRNHGGMRGRVRLFLAISGWRGQSWQQHGSGQTWGSSMAQARLDLCPDGNAYTMKSTNATNPCVSSGTASC